jgi:hypothetical protein
MEDILPSLRGVPIAGEELVWLLLEAPEPARRGKQKQPRSRKGRKKEDRPAV